MSQPYLFQPRRSLGVIIHVGAIALLGWAAALGLLRATDPDIGPAFLLYLLPVLLALFVVPALVYRLYALRNAYYILERDGLRLHWGLRTEDIPMNTVLWVRPARELEGRLPLPWLRWPGALLGTRRLHPSGEVEFMAAGLGGLVVIATAERLFAVSPGNPQLFLETFERLMELGSLAPIPARSVYPAFLLGQVWAETPARLLLLAAGCLALALLVAVSLVIPAHAQVFLGFTPEGLPRDLVPSVRLYLLPVLNGLIFTANLFLGLFFFRQVESRPLAYILWAASAIIPLLFLVGVFAILRYLPA